MEDLKNLTLDELLTTNDPVTDTQVWAEIRRRLEEWAVLEETLRKSQRIEKEGIAAIASAAAAEKRLAKCEAALKKTVSILTTARLVVDAARAAMEE